MAFNTADPRAEYTATGGQTNFPFTFAVFLNTDVKYGSRIVRVLAVLGVVLWVIFHVTPLAVIPYVKS